MKIISKVLIFTMVVSLFASFTGLAYDRMEQELIETVKAEKLWKEGEFMPGKEINAVQLADLLNTTLGIDNSAEFIPGYAENKIITRTDLAVTADKLGFELVPNYANETVYREIYIDTDHLTDAQFQSVTNATYYGTVLALPQKKFGPDTNATCFTAAKAAVTLRAMINKVCEYTVRDAKASDNPEKFDVYQKGVLHTDAGMAGFGFVARFDGAPGEIYIARTTVEPLLENQWGNIAAPVTVVNIIDPNGNTAARISMDIDDGKIAKVVNIPEGPAGIYQISFATGRVGDICEVAVNNAVSWGVRGEQILGYTETTPKTGYIYIPSSYKHLSLAIGGPGEDLTLSSLDGKEVYETTESIRCIAFEAIETNALKP
ncbi:MAG: hypothetical protein WCX81_01360, partial [Monoglobales bacterium]